MARAGARRHLTFAAISFILLLSRSVFASGFNEAPYAGDSVSIFVLNKVVLLGNKFTNSEIILRELPFKEGDTVTVQEVNYARERIYSTGLFAKVMTNIEKLRRGKADLLIYVEERWYIWPYPVFGFWDRDVKKFYAGAGIADLNLSGLDDPLWATVAFGYNPFGGITYTNPAVGKNKRYMVTLSANYSHGMAFGSQSIYSSGEFNAVFGNLGIDVGRRFGIYSSLTLGLRYNYVSESSDSEHLVLSPTGKDNFASAGLDYVYDSRDLKSFATQGAYFDIGISKYGFGESSVDFGRARFDARSYLPFFNSLTFASRVYGNFAWGPGIPMYDNVFIGYYERIRGMFNTVSEGQSMLGGNLELRIPIIRSFYLEIPGLPIKQDMNPLSVRSSISLSANPPSGPIKAIVVRGALRPLKCTSNFSLDFSWSTNLCS